MQTAFDPNQPQDIEQFPFEARQQLIEQRKRMLTELMKHQVEGSTPRMPQGQMVGGQFVNPHWSEYLAAGLQPALTAWQTSAAEKQLAQDQSEYSKADQAAGAQHVAQRPSSRVEQDAPQDIAGNIVQGPERTVAPTAQEMSAWAQKGSAIPSRKKVMEALIADQEVNAPIREEARTQKNLDREDTQQARKDALDANLQVRREQLRQNAEEALQRSQDTQLAIEQRREAAKQHADLMRELGKARVDAATAARGNKPLPNAVHRELSDAETNAATMTQLNSSFDPSFSGLKATIRNAAAPYDPTGTLDDSGAQWWKQYKKQASLTERHALFGASLTGNEQASWNAADINQGMQPDMIKKNLAIRERLAHKVFANGVDRYEKGGYPQVRNAFDPVAPRSTGTGVSGSWEGPTKGSGNGDLPIQVLDASDYADVPSGASYMDPSGVKRVKP
jgi:hypothetical protein